MPATAFVPAQHGFHFPNRFKQVQLPVLRGPKVSLNGLCGGMCATALDYFHDAKPVPARTDLPGDDDPLTERLLVRQAQSLLNDSALRFIVWSMFPDDLLGFGKGVRAWTAEEVDKLRPLIDAGTPTVLGMIVARTFQDIPSNHQVVAVGYDDVAGGVDIHVYDPNSPDVDAVLPWRRGTTDIVATNRAGRKPWRGLFVHDYDRAPAPDIT
jgi:hypothetical protein